MFIALTPPCFLALVSGPCKALYYFSRDSLCFHAAKLLILSWRVSIEGISMLFRRAAMLIRSLILMPATSIIPLFAATCNFFESVFCSTGKKTSAFDIITPLIQAMYTILSWFGPSRPLQLEILFAAARYFISFFWLLLLAKSAKI